MSSKERFGGIVWDALFRVHGDDGMGGVYVYRTPAQIAEIGEVSIPTARKYLKILAEQGHAKTMKWGRVTVYGPNADMYSPDVINNPYQE